MQGIYNYTPETNQILGYVLLQLSVCTVCATYNVISHVKYVLYLYIGTSRSVQQWRTHEFCSGGGGFNKCS